MERAARRRKVEYSTTNVKKLALGGAFFMSLKKMIQSMSLCVKK